MLLPVQAIQRHAGSGIGVGRSEHGLEISPIGQIAQVEGIRYLYPLLLALFLNFGNLGLNALAIKSRWLAGLFGSSQRMEVELRACALMHIHLLFNELQPAIHSQDSLVPVLF
jgi:hypothetical protein